MKCQFCPEVKLEIDATKGLIYCPKCGSIQEENSLVSSLNFVENRGASQLTGQIIQMSENLTKVGKTFLQTSSFYIETKIQNICIGLGLTSDHASCAFRWYKLAIQHNISKGKNILYTLSACIYIVCRQEKTPHMLIDFSALLRINVFKIGTVFIKILNCLKIKIALVDPSLYVPRFFSKLKLKNYKIIDTSVRLISRMKRDWIVTGRRPNNLCGAAILISCRIYNEERTIEEISRIVHASVGTINLRLDEIASTETANLSIKDFNGLWIENEEEPPSIKKRKNADSRSTSLHAEIENEILAPIICNFGQISAKEKLDENLHIEATKTDICLLYQEECKKAKYISEYDESLHIDDTEIESMILTQDETNKRAEIWDQMYGEYMEWKNNRPVVEKKGVKKRPQKSFDTFKDALMDCITEKNLKSKINFDVIKKLFN